MTTSVGLSIAIMRKKNIEEKKKLLKTIYFTLLKVKRLDNNTYN